MLEVFSFYPPVSTEEWQCASPHGAPLAVIKRNHGIHQCFLSPSVDRSKDAKIDKFAESNVERQGVEKRL